MLSSSCESFSLLRAFLHQRKKLELSRKNQRTNVVMTNFCFVCCIRIKNSKPSNSVPDLFIRPASIVAKGFHLQLPGFILSPFKILESPNFAAKDNFCLSSKLISVQSLSCRGLYDKWLTSLSRFCLFTRSCQVFTWENFGRRWASFKICLLWPKFIKSRKTILTCKMVVMTENLSK